MVYQYSMTGEMLQSRNDSKAVPQDRPAPKPHRMTLPGCRPESSELSVSGMEAELVLP